jgi:predicted PurR-regulated permease PerM
VGLSRTLATLIVTLGFIVLLALLVALIVPLLVGEIIQLAEKLPAWFETLRAQISDLGESLQTRVDPAVMDQIRSVVVGSKERLASWATGIARDVLSGGFALFNVISLLLITPIVAFYLLRDWDRLLDEGDKLLPPAYAETIREQVREIDRTLSGFVRGTGTVCIALGTYYAIGLTVAGLDFGLVIGLTAGLISFVPYLGATLGLLAAVGTALVQFDGYLMAAVVAAIFLFGQFVEGNILQPTLVGERVRLHPVWVIFALLAGGLLFGFAGVLLAVPTAAVIGVLVRFAVSQYRRKVLSQPTAPAVDTSQ